MAERKTPNKGYQKLKRDLSAGNIGQVYIFYGEESYLREYYLGEIKKKLVPAGFEEFNYHRLSGKTLTMQELNEAVEAMPMMAERTLIVVDPMLATGGSSSAALSLLKEKGAKHIILMCLVAAPEGVRVINHDHPDVPLYVAAIDEKLNEKGYIVPGLGDAGDRIFGTL